MCPFSLKRFRRRSRVRTLTQKKHVITMAEKQHDIHQISCSRKTTASRGQNHHGSSDLTVYRGKKIETYKKKDDEHHIGIENVRDRLRLMCGGTLEVQSRASDGTVITVSIPVQTQPKGALSSG